MSDNAIIEGVVTAVNEKLLTFEINGTTTVHMGLMFANNHTDLPAKGAEVKVSSRFYNFNQISITSMILTREDCVFETDLSVTPSDGIFRQILPEMDVWPSEFLLFAHNYDKMKTSFKLPDGISHDEVLMSVVKKLQHMRFELQFISKKIFFDDNLDVYKEFSFWTFGNHCNWGSALKEKYLIGFLRVDSNTGGIYFTDFTSEMPCLLLNSSDFDVKKVLNSYILIRDFTFITEVYNSNKVITLVYVLMNASKIINLDINPINEEKVPDSRDCKRTWTIISKSSPMVISSDDVSYWLEVRQENRSKAFVRLDTWSLNIFPVLKMNYSYDVHFKTLPTKTFNKEIYKTNSSIPQLKVFPDTVFIPREKSPSEKILTASEALKSLSSSDLISFEGTISLKKFVNPLGSRTTAVSNDRKFGTPGFKTHVLEFKTDGKPLIFYLNNWENLAVPHGLIPNMRVIVRNAKSQSRSYYKSTVMTSIEIVNYEPKMKFETATLRESVWVGRFFLGSGSLIPNGVIIYATTLSLFVLGLKIRVEKSGSDHQIHVKAQVTLIAVDQMGESKVIAKEQAGLVLLRLLLRMYEPAFKKWCQGFEYLTDYVYYKGMPSEKFLAKKENLPQIFLTEYLKSLETQSFTLHLKCRKMDDEPSGKSVYFFLDGYF